MGLKRLSSFIRGADTRCGAGDQLERIFPNFKLSPVELFS